MDVVQLTVSLGHALRKEHKLKVRQPLSAAHLVSSDPKILSFLMDQQHLIADELNVKKVTFSNDEKEFVGLKAKPNFRVLGKKVGRLMKSAQAAIETFSQQQLKDFLDGKQVSLDLEGHQIVLTSEDLQVERTVHEGLVAANQGLITIALDSHLSAELLQEGLAREIVNKVNTMRRDAGLAVTDRINLHLKTTERVKQSYDIFKDYISQEILAEDVQFEPFEASEKEAVGAKIKGTEWDLNGEPAIISIKRCN